MKRCQKSSNRLKKENAFLISTRRLSISIKASTKQTYLTKLRPFTRRLWRHPSKEKTIWLQLLQNGDLLSASGIFRWTTQLRLKQNWMDKTFSNSFNCGNKPGFFTKRTDLNHRTLQNKNLPYFRNQNKTKKLINLTKFSRKNVLKNRWTIFFLSRHT